MNAAKESQQCTLTDLFRHKIILFNIQHIELNKEQQTGKCSKKNKETGLER